jgi:hypothetical protein
MSLERNRTESYLSSVLNTFNLSFKEGFRRSKACLRGYFIANGDYYKAKGFTKPQELLFMIYDPKGQLKDDRYTNPVYHRKLFAEWLKAVRKSSHYYDDFTDNFQMHWIVVKVTPYEKAFQHFILGEYSLMYDPAHFTKLNIREDSPLGKVLLRKEEAVETLRNAIYTSYGVSELPENIREYDVPPRLQYEIYEFERHRDLIARIFPKMNT